jgi:hypothetical protein
MELEGTFHSQGSFALWIEAPDSLKVGVAFVGPSKSQAGDEPEPGSNPS